MDVYLFSEDSVCERLGFALIRHVAPSARCVTRLTSGYGRIKSDIPKYVMLARVSPVVVIVDLDDRICPVKMLGDWGVPDAIRGLAFRVAVTECESWLMADKEAVGGYFGFSAAILPADPDSLPDPKSSLLALIRKKSKGRRSIRADVLPQPGSSSPVGLGYNLRMREFIDSEWSAERAARNSKSLDRALRRVERLLDVLPS